MRAPPSLKGARYFALNIARAWMLVWRAAPSLTVASLVLAVVQGVLPLAALYLVKLIIDAIAQAAAGTVDATAMQPVFLLIVLAVGVALGAVLFNSLAGVVGEAHAQCVADNMHDVLHAKSIEVDLEYYENSQYYDTL